MIVGKKLGKHIRLVIRTKRADPPDPAKSPQAALYFALLGQWKEALKDEGCPGPVCRALSVMLTAAADAYDDVIYYAYQRYAGGAR